MKLETPEQFFNSIPRDLEENYKFRLKLHDACDKDVGLQEAFLKLCLLDYRIAFNSAFWTANPRGLPGERNFPFILRPKQEEVVSVLQYCITNQEDMGINKSRDEGCTEIVCKVAALTLFIKETYGIVGSRNKDLVDCLGDPYTLMAKIDYALKTMPKWMQNVLGNIDRKELQISVPKYNSVIKGETTNESFSAGRRATFMFLDEFGRVEPRIAKSIEGSIHDVTGCVIYGSTHWYGYNHPFNEALKKSTTHLVELPWWENPNKNKGLYKTPDYNEIQIVDTQYYKDKYPRIKALHSSEPFLLSELDTQLMADGYEGDSPKLIADGGDGLPEGYFLRSPWHDAEEEKRKTNKRDFFSNIWMDPIGSQDSFFNQNVLRQIKTDFLSKPKYEGELDWQYKDDGRVSRNSQFKTGVGRKRLRWWGELPGLRPNQDHNYVIGCDISMGSGNSNSVAMIYDCNTQTLVGSWVCPNTPPEKFMDTVVALARWCGGITGEALVIYETNGPGVNAHKRLLWNGHNRIYIQRTEDAKKTKRKNKYGWSSNPQAKESLLGELSIAIGESLRPNTKARQCFIKDIDLVKELESYVFLENGDIAANEQQDESSGARKRHGDRVIAAGLCILGAKYQRAGDKEETIDIPVNTFKYLLEQEAKKQREIKHTTRRYLF